jgi:glycosyltransferase involved in cell wall biosynthesis
MNDSKSLSMEHRKLEGSPFVKFPKVSVITASFNSENTIHETIFSVNAQTYPDIEHIFIDGGSTDSTLEIIRKECRSSSIIISEKDYGIYDAMNKGVQLATGDVIGILNSDDFYLSDHVLEAVAAHFAADPELEVVLGDVDFVNDDDLARTVRYYPAGNFKPWMFRFGLMPPHPATFVRKSAYERVGLYKLGYEIAADFDLLIRLLLVGGAKYRTARKTWVRMRTGGASTSGLKSMITITREFKRSLNENNFYTNYLMLACRLPFKLLTQLVGKRG